MAGRERRTWILFMLLNIFTCALVGVAAGDGGVDGGVAEVVLGSEGEAERVIVSVGGAETKGRNATTANRTVPASLGPCFVDDVSCNPEDIPCSQDHDCYDAFPNLDVAVSLTTHSLYQPLPTCLDDWCSCGEGNCVSQSKTFDQNTVFYYCGPCGFVGSRCVKDTCSHEWSKCFSSYCSCENGGTFYELSYCEMPYVGDQTALQDAVIVCLIIALCFLLASIYSVILSRRLIRIPAAMRRHRYESEASNQAPPNDTPPIYDDVVEKPPTYQDALEMSAQDDTDGITNSTINNGSPHSSQLCIQPEVDVEKEGDCGEESEEVKVTSGTQLKMARQQVIIRAMEDVNFRAAARENHQQCVIPANQGLPLPLNERRSSSLSRVHQLSTRSEPCWEPTELPLQEALEMQVRSYNLNI